MDVKKISPSRRAWLAMLALLFLASYFPWQGQVAHAEGPALKIFAAASMKDAFDAAGHAYTEKTGQTLSISYAASSALAKQIEQAAPADVFISADLAWMDYLAERSLLLKGTRRNLAGNALVLIGPAASTLNIDIAPGFDLAGALGDGRLAVGNVASVPAGKYAKAALESLKVWESVADKLAQAENVRSALAYVAQGETPLGIVYKTDAAAEPKVKVIASFPANSHPAIIYPIAVMKQTTAPDAAKAFVAYLGTADAMAILEKHGFVPAP
ncbi:MAG: molybdate ABC transporter substrate-binding protein [Hyphomicrobiaceae bacterium]